MRRGAALIAVAVVTLVGTACVEPLSTKGNTDAIQLVSTTTAGGWKYDYYRNNAYPCSVSGNQTFVVATSVGASTAPPAPLWAFMHGGGAGYFDENGNPVPNAKQKVEEAAASLITHLTNGGLLAHIRADAAGFRTVAVSYCSHDVYAGADTPDPNNPNTTPDGKPR